MMLSVKPSWISSAALLYDEISINAPCIAAKACLGHYSCLHRLYTKYCSIPVFLTVYFFFVIMDKMIMEGGYL